MLPGE
jgi:ferritin